MTHYKDMDLDGVKITDLIICVPRIIERKVIKKRCRNCKSDQPILWEHLEFYGIDETCLRCGDRWNDGELCPEPTEHRRGWRQRSVRDALDRLDKPVDKPLWKSATDDE